MQAFGHMGELHSEAVSKVDFFCIEKNRGKIMNSLGINEVQPVGETNVLLCSCLILSEFVR